MPLELYYISQNEKVFLVIVGDWRTCKVAFLCLLLMKKHSYAYYVLHHLCGDV